MTRAVVTQGQLWLLSDAGVLSSVKLHSRVLIRQRIGSPVLDICVRAGDPEIAVVGPGEAMWTIEHFSKGKWLVDESVPRDRDQFIALDCAGNDLAILTSRRLISIRQRTQRFVTLSQGILPDYVASVFGTPQDVFVGINAGEWGGGLRRIVRRTGAVINVARNASGALCGGPLNTDCDPVTAISADPWNAHCVVIAIGLEHMASYGRVDEVCGDNVRRLYYKKYPFAFKPNCKRLTGTPCETVAFFGVARRGDELLAAGNDGLYRIKRDGSATYSHMPKFALVGGIYVSYSVPGFVLVLTDVNRRLSVSGSVPMLVRR